MSVTPISPVPEVGLEGYLSEISVVAGGSAELMLSGGGEAQLGTVRLRHGDPNPDGPGVRESLADWPLPSAVDLVEQGLDLGSFVRIGNDGSLTPNGPFTFVAWIKPTRLSGGWQTIAAMWAPDRIGFGFFLSGHRTLLGAVSSDGSQVEWCAGLEYVVPGAWQQVALRFDADDRELAVLQRSPADIEARGAVGFGEAGVTASRRPVPSGERPPCDEPLLLGALALPDRLGHWAHFDGKIASPALLPYPIDDASLEVHSSRGAPALAARAIGAWDLSADTHTTRIVDCSSNRNHGEAVNAPTRAVTGPRFGGEAGTLASDRPHWYDAVHLHSDDLDDAGWPAAATIRVPANAPSGVYAVRVRSGRDALTLPIVVRPRRPTATLLVLLPTFTWQAYGSNRAPYSQTEDGMVDRGLCLYDVHADGSMVRLCSRLKPTRSGDPSRGIRQWGAHTLAANLYLIDWLEQLGEAYDVASDNDLHRSGAGLLDRYRCIALGSHHEYWTDAMLDALETYLANGGRALYLGGNGLYWVTSLDPERPHLMEVRKSGDGEYEAWFASPEPGETQHASTRETGGLWSRRGRPPRAFVGVEHCANVFTRTHSPCGYEPLAARQDSRVAFVFDGVEDGPIGAFGLNLGSAAGYEMDATQPWQHPPGWEVIPLARAASPDFIAPMRLPASPRAEIALTTIPNGGAVFAAGAVTWTGSLSYNTYRNSVSQITGNVLRRFLSVPPGASILDSDRDGT